jgi:hypothetical protein
VCRRIAVLPMLTHTREQQELGTKNKPEAIRCLKRKARYVKQQEMIDGQRDTLEAQVRCWCFVTVCILLMLTPMSQQIGALEMSATDSEVLAAISMGGQALRNNQKDADKIGDIMDDVQEQVFFSFLYSFFLLFCFVGCVET